MIGGEIGPAGLELDRARHAEADPPQPAGQTPAVVSQERSNSSSTRPRHVLRAASISAGSAWWPRIRPSRVGHGDIDARRPQVGHEDVAGVGPERRAGAAGGRRCSARPRPRSPARVRSARRRAGRRSPGRGRSGRPAPSASGTARADLVEDDDQRVERLVGQRARPPARSGRVLQARPCPRCTPRSVASPDFCT